MATTKPVESALDPYRMARRVTLLLNTKYHNGQFFTWRMNHYAPITDCELKAKVTGIIKQEIEDNNLTHKGKLVAVTTGRLGDVMTALRAVSLVPGTTVMPAWLDGSDREMFAFSNGLLDVRKALTHADAEPEPHSLDYFNSIVLPFNYDEDATASRWTSFLNEVLEGDNERIAMLQEFFGYCLLPGNWMQKFFLLEGSGANGKSVVLKTLEALLGKSNTSAVPLGLFGERFQLVPTIGKLVNLSPEADSSDRPHMGTLKAFTAGDPLTIDRKGLPQITVTPTAKLIISANSRPTFVDRSDGLWRRLEVIPFRITIPAEKQDAGLVDKLSRELPGIFNWSLIGLKRLRSQKAFTKSAVVQAAVEEYKLESNSARMFINEFGIVSAPSDKFLPVAEVIKAYTHWCDANGYTALSGKNFGKELRRLFPDVIRTQKMIHGHRPTVYVGIAYAPLPDMSADPEVIRMLEEAALARV